MTCSIELGTISYPSTTIRELNALEVEAARLGTAPESSRRVAASTASAMGESPNGRVGEWLANGLKIWLTAAATTFATLVCVMVAGDAAPTARSTNALGV